MITQVSGFNAGGIIRDPRRKSQSVEFKHQAKIPYKSAAAAEAYGKEFKQQQQKALRTSIATIAGCGLFLSLIHI